MTYEWDTRDTFDCSFESFFPLLSFVVDDGDTNTASIDSRHSVLSFLAFSFFFFLAFFSVFLDSASVGSVVTVAIPMLGAELCTELDPGSEIGVSPLVTDEVVA